MRVAQRGVFGEGERDGDEDAVFSGSGSVHGRGVRAGSGRAVEPRAGRLGVLRGVYGDEDLPKIQRSQCVCVRVLPLH